MIGMSRLCAYQPERPPTAHPARTSVCQCAWFLIRAGADIERQQQQRVGRRMVPPYSSTYGVTSAAATDASPLGKLWLMPALEPQARIVLCGRAAPA